MTTETDIQRQLRESIHRNLHHNLLILLCAQPQLVERVWLLLERDAIEPIV